MIRTLNSVINNVMCTPYCSQHHHTTHLQHHATSNRAQQLFVEQHLVLAAAHLWKHTTPTSHVISLLRATTGIAQPMVQVLNSIHHALSCRHQPLAACKRRAAACWLPARAQRHGCSSTRLLPHQQSNSQGLQGEHKAKSEEQSKQAARCLQAAACARATEW